MGGIAIGTFALLLILSVFNGFSGLVLSLYNQFTPDIVIESTAGKSFRLDSSFLSALKEDENIRAVAEVIEENVLLRYGSNQCLARAKGITDNYNAVSNIANATFHGEYLLQDDQANPFVFMGAGVEQQLQVNYDDPFGFVAIYYPKKNMKVTVDPQSAFNVTQAKPSGSFAIQQEFDNRFVFVPIGVMRELTGGTDNVSSLEVSLKETDKASQTIRRLRERLGGDFKLSNRYQQNEVLYKVMQSERWAVFAILGFVLLIASFNIIGAVAMLVIEKRKDIGVLKVLGFDNGMVRGVFFSEGWLLSLVGFVIGAVLAFAVCTLQQMFGIVKLGGGTFVVDAYPVDMKVLDFVLVFGMVMLIGLVAAWLPSKRASADELRLA